MPLYSLDGDKPETPAEGQWWLAPDAHVIGRSGWRPGSESGSAPCCAATMNGSRSARTAMSREGCVFHTDMGFPLTVGARCTIGHRAILHGCTIGENSLVGMGATVLNGARIGRNSLVGANALVTEGREFPDNSLIVGAPAKAIRTLDDKAAVGIAASAAGYARRWRQFAAGLKRLD